jgi:hypothetical protein
LIISIVVIGKPYRGCVNERQNGDADHGESLAPARHFLYLTNGKEQPAKSIR